MAQLIALIEDRKQHPRAGSYTNRLLSDPVHAARKVGEEANEVVVAALAQSDQRLVEEMADLIYHSLVLLAAHGISWSDVLAELQRRHSERTEETR
ncbi:MAG: phosphoribosyl-ATP diphosphatase [Anaerolineae bacterium]|nr:phosphoribosyl-ATP diphosphatase [Anaerolineae bacterium]MDW8071558.1 phosphoribosyl-ATP diphosphatase [Anaerolineae bacterium]